MIGPYARLVATTFAAVLATHSPCGSAQEAPFGFHWGDRSLPKPTEMLQEKNITALLYRRDTIPEHIRDAEEIILKVCDQEGLQQVIWVSRLLSGEDARRKFAVIYAEGAHRYGEADDGDPSGGTASRSSARVTMFAKLADSGFYHIFTIQDHPAFRACGKESDKDGILAIHVSHVAFANSIWEIRGLS
jgi:hypothetical protein